MSAMYIHVAVDLFSELDYHALVVSLCSIIIIITYSHDNNIILQVAALAPLALLLLLEARCDHLVVAHLNIMLWSVACQTTPIRLLQWEQWCPCPRWKAA